MNEKTHERSQEVKGRRRRVIRPLHWVKRWMYRGGRPRTLARVMNRLSAIQFSAGLLSPSRAMTLEVRGRHSGKVISFPVVVAEHEGGRYLVSMLGQNANWVMNVRAAEGRAVLCRGGRKDIRLHEVEPPARAAILRTYLAVAPGARPHIPVDPHAPLEDFQRIAAEYPVFRIAPAPPE
jgi:deazaflavin-dependent oxidoreductase (nitroreductase family)